MTGLVSILLGAIIQVTLGDKHSQTLPPSGPLSTITPPLPAIHLSVCLSVLPPPLPYFLPLFPPPLAKTNALKYE